VVCNSLPDATSGGGGTPLPDTALGAGPIPDAAADDAHTPLPDVAVGVAPTRPLSSCVKQWLVFRYDASIYICSRS
jgi:hypothetical protein